MVYIFSQENWFYFNKVSGAKQFEIEENGVFYETKAFNLTSTKEKIIKTTLDSLVNYMQNDKISKSLCFPELILPIQVILKSFRKNCENLKFTKIVGSFADNVIQK
jgi:hypothetical protein